MYSSSMNAAFFLAFEAILFQRGRLKSYKFVPEGMYSGILASHYLGMLRHKENCVWFKETLYT